ncbi:MAG TPA: pirin family protein [Ilumatobacteraceae bacterium]|nr:pirin family protein [Ilumatobacteraceae bacterium]
MTVERVIAPRRRRVGAAEVDRLLPYHARRMVGPFIFADLMGPEDLAPGHGADVAPHPHVGLATVTYLFDGALVHRDSTGAVQRIEPGGVNWMTAGSGVAHSERSPDDARAARSGLAGLQTWVALPDEAEEADPSFQHAAAPALPAVGDGGVTIRLLVGSAFGAASPVPGASPLFHADVHLAAGARMALPGEHPERAVLVVDGEVEVDGQRIPPRHLAVADAGEAVVRATSAARVVTFGGAPVGRRFIWWNFVASSEQRIERAKADWATGRIGAVPGETERIELPRF